MSVSQSGTVGPIKVKIVSGWTENKTFLSWGFFNIESEGIGHRSIEQAIEAIPDMLEALKECVKVYEEHRDHQPTGHLWPDPNHIHHARRAIAKAEGGTV